MAIVEHLQITVHEGHTAAAAAELARARQPQPPPPPQQQQQQVDAEGVCCIQLLPEVRRTLNLEMRALLIYIYIYTYIHTYIHTGAEDPRISRCVRF
jgi:hypothetical protein